MYVYTSVHTYMYVCEYLCVCVCVYVHIYAFVSGNMCVPSSCKRKRPEEHSCNSTNCKVCRDNRRKYIQLIVGALVTWAIYTQGQLLL